MENSDTTYSKRKQFESNNDLCKPDDKTISCGIECMGEEAEDIPKWAHFICPSCGISYGISALLRAVRNGLGG